MTTTATATYRYKFDPVSDGCAYCGAPEGGHGPEGQCDPDAVALADATVFSIAKAERELDILTERAKEMPMVVSVERNRVARDALVEVRRLTAIVHRAAKQLDEANAKAKGKMGVVIAIIVGILSAGAAASSCVNSGINYRQMRALEKMSSCTSGALGTEKIGTEKRP